MAESTKALKDAIRRIETLERRVSYLYEKLIEPKVYDCMVCQWQANGLDACECSPYDPANSGTAGPFKAEDSPIDPQIGVATYEQSNIVSDLEPDRGMDDYERQLMDGVIDAPKKRTSSKK
jgi:hypothetical protein